MLESPLKMTTCNPKLPSRLPELVLRALGETGRYVIKNPCAGTYLELGEVEHFLLIRLDGVQTAEDICRAYEQKFSESLSPAELQEFIELARSKGLLAETTHQSNGAKAQVDRAKPKKRQSLLYFRFSLFDPNRLFDWLAPKVSIFWTRTFLSISAVAIVAAGLTLWGHRHELAVSLGHSVRWETLVVAWVAIVAATFCHEFAHGLTVKRYGGEVHEVGVLMMFFTPCFYCNVSDAWLIPEKSKRLLVTLAGAYCDLCIWAAATIVWRLTIPQTLVNYLAWVLLTVCGARVLMNFNPLMKLDGYYLLIDWLELPNLRRRGEDCWMGHVRWLLWGAPRPAPQERGRVILTYGAIAWLFSVLFLDVLFMGLCRWLGNKWGWIGIVAGASLGLLVLRRLFQGFCSGEVTKMFTMRPTRTKLWVGGTAAALIGLFVGRAEDRTSGSFQVRPNTKAELRAAVAGFLRDVQFDEGERVAAETLIARLEVPDLSSLMAQKHAQIRESQANLRCLEAGTRHEELIEARQKVKRATTWRDLAAQDLVRGKEVLREDALRLEQRIGQYQLELEYTARTAKQSEVLYQKGALAGQQLMADRKKLQIAESQWRQAQAEGRARQSQGVLTYEAELAHREKELADTKAALALLEAGSRPEQVDAEVARLARLQEELAYLASLENKSQVLAPVDGVITTGHLKEKIGQYFEKGALICVVEDLTELEVEIALPEQDVLGVTTGQTVELKARAVPFETFHAKVERIAPAATTAAGAPQSQLVVYCKVQNPDGQLRSGMTGFARIYRGSRSLATIATHRAVRYLRTEFWW